LKQRMIDDACAEASAAFNCRSFGDVSVTCFTTSLHDRAVSGSATGSPGDGVGDVGVTVGSAEGTTVRGGPEVSGSRGW